MNKISRRHPVLKKVLLITVAVIILFTAGSMGFSAIFFEIIFPRRPSPAGEYPEGVALRPVEFESGGNMLRGHVCDAKDPRGVVIIACGVGGGADSHAEETEFFRRNGWSVLSYDPTGVGESEGRGTVGLSQSKRDLEAALAFAAEDTALEGLPVALYGHSAGGYAVLAAGESAPGVCAVVSLAPFCSPVETMRFHARRYVGFLADVEYPFMVMQNYFTFGDDANVNALDAVNSSDVPTLIVVAADDSVVPDEIGFARFADEIANPNATVIIVSDPAANSHSALWHTPNLPEMILEMINKE